MFIILASIVPILFSGATRMFPQYLISWFGGLRSHTYTLNYLHPVLLKTLTSASFALLCYCCHFLCPSCWHLLLCCRRWLISLLPRNRTLPVWSELYSLIIFFNYFFPRWIKLWVFPICPHCLTSSCLSPSLIICSHPLELTHLFYDFMWKRHK